LSQPIAPENSSSARSPEGHVVPEQTLRRWRRRLSSQARSVVQALAGSARPALERTAAALGLGATRRALIERCAVSLAGLAALVHRLTPGLRLM
jgi:hypothetical protein